jgi:hypothetical protein
VPLSVAPSGKLAAAWCSFVAASGSHFFNQLAKSQKKKRFSSSPLECRTKNDNGGRGVVICSDLYLQDCEMAAYRLKPACGPNEIRSETTLVAADMGLPLSFYPFRRQK